MTLLFTTLVILKNILNFYESISATTTDLVIINPDLWTSYICSSSGNNLVLIDDLLITHKLSPLPTNLELIKPSFNSMPMLKLNLNARLKLFK